MKSTDFYLLKQKSISEGDSSLRLYQDKTKTCKIGKPIGNIRIALSH